MNASPESPRQTQIMDAVERLLGRGGVSAVTMRAVAAEAGVSLRLVQYYGLTKDQLLTATLDRLARRSVERWRSRSDDAGTAVPAEDLIRSFLAEALPADAASQAFHRVGVSLEALAVTAPGVAGEAYRRHLSALADHLGAGLSATTRLGPASARLLALEVMAVSHGVGTLVLAGQLTERDAQAQLADYLERLRPRLAA